MSCASDDDERRTSTTPLRRQRTKSTPAENSAAAIPTLHCWLCGLNVEGPTKHLFSKLFHAGPCHNAVKCYRRYMAGNAAALEAADKQMVTGNGEAWRAEVRPLLAEPGKRSITARRALKTKIIEESRAYQQMEEVEDQIIFNKAMYKAYKRQHCDMSSEAASSDFEDQLRKQDACHSTRTEARVSVTERRLRKVKGHSSSSIQQTHFAATFTSDVGAGMLAADDGSNATPRPSRHQRRSRSPRGGRDPGSRGRSKSRDRRHARSRDRRRDHRRSASASPKPRTPASARSSAKAHAQRRPASDSDEDVCGDEGAPSRLSRASPAAPGSASASAASAPSSARGNGSSTSLSSLDFLVERTRLKALIDKHLIELSGLKSIPNKLRASVDKVDQEDIEALATPPSEALSKVDLARMTLETLRKEADKLKIANIVEFATKTDEAIDSLNAGIQICADVFAAVDYAVNLAAKEQKKGRNQNMYARLRVQNKLERVGGFGPLQAKALMLKVGASNQDGMKGDFKFDEVRHWDGSTPFGASVKKIFDDALQEGLTVFNEKKQSLAAAMTTKPTWGSSQSKLPEVKFESMNTLSDIPLFSNDPGAAAWLVALRQWHWRHGPQAVPLPGLPSFWHNKSDRMDIVIQLFPCDGILSKGIAPGDLKQFLETTTGQSFFDEKGDAVLLAPGHSLFTPCGMLASPVACFDLDSKLTEVQRRTYYQENAFLVHLPVLAKAATASTAASTLQAICDLNYAYLSKHSTTKLWGERYTAVQEWATAVGATTTT